MMGRVGRSYPRPDADARQRQVSSGLADSNRMIFVQARGWRSYGAAVISALAALALLAWLVL